MQPTNSKNAQVHQDREDRRGHVRHGVQGEEQRDGRDRGAEEGAAGRRRRGGAVVGPPRNLHPEGAEARERGAAVRRAAHREEDDPRVRVLRDGPEEVLRPVRGVGAARDHQVVHAPADEGAGLLPRPAHTPPRPQAAEPSDQQERRAEAGRLRPGPLLRHPGPLLQRGSGHAVVQTPRRALRRQALLDHHRHVVGRLHLRRDFQLGGSPVSGQRRGRPAAEDIQGAGHAHAGRLAGGAQAARVQALLRVPEPPELGHVGAPPEQSGPQPSVQAARFQSDGKADRCCGAQASVFCMKSFFFINCELLLLGLLQCVVKVFSKMLACYNFYTF